MKRYVVEKIRLFFRCYKETYKLRVQLRNVEMTEKILTELNMRTYQHSDMQNVTHIWKECGLIRSWNNPKLDIQRKVKIQKDLFFVAELSNRIIATAMFGYDGHRGWLNYFAVLPQFQKSGYGKQLLEFGEKILFDKGCPKINL